MAEDSFNFILYRINKVSDDTLWSIMKNRPFETDQDIRDFLTIACQERYDEVDETERNIYKWSIRKGSELINDSGEIIADVYVIAKSLMEKDALVVDDEGLHEDRSVSSPAPAEAMMMIVYWKRHIVLVENRSAMTTGETWLKHYKRILQKVYSDNEWDKYPHLENIPPENEILKEFNAMDVVHRVKVNIKLPNPDMSRLTRALIAKLKQDSIQELKQDMFSPHGLSKSENGLPHASLSVAEHGYKEGPVIIEGRQGSVFKRIETGTSTTKGAIANMKTFVRGLRANVKTKEGSSLISAVEKELDNLVPTDE